MPDGDKYDLETLEADFLAILQEKIPAKITAINTAKNDTLLTTPDNADYFVDLSARKPNTPTVFIHYGLGEIEALDNGGEIAEVVQLFCIFMVNKKNNQDARKMVLRYTRAVKEVINENFRRLRNSSSMKVMTLMPGDFVDEQNNGKYTAGGAVFETSIG